MAVQRAKGDVDEWAMNKSSRATSLSRALPRSGPSGCGGPPLVQTFHFSWLGIELSLLIIVIKYPPHLISLLLLSYPSAPFGFFLSFAFILALDTLGSSFVIMIQ